MPSQIQNLKSEMPKMSKVLTVSIEIEAPLELVWRILTDFTNYELWNPFTPRVECHGRVGTPVTIEAHLTDSGKGRMTYLSLNTFEPPHKLCWGADHWYLQVNRCQTLTAVGPTHTRYETSELFAGLLSPLVIWTQYNNLMRGYQRAAAGLKQTAEAMSNE